MNPSWSGESPICVDWSSHSTEPHAHCILFFWWVLPYDILVMAYLINLRIRTKTILVYIFFIVVLPRVCILNVIYSLSCWTHPLIIYPFQAYSLIAGYFCWTFWTCLLVVICTFLLCQVSAPKLWNDINSCIKTITLYYEVSLLLMLC